MNRILFAVLAVLGIGVASSSLAPTLGCVRMPPAVVRQLEQLAGEHCLETDNVEICARKCADAAAPK